MTGVGVEKGTFKAAVDAEESPIDEDRSARQAREAATPDPVDDVPDPISEIGTQSSVPLTSGIAVVSSRSLEPDP